MKAIKVEYLSKIYDVAHAEERTIGFRELLTQQLSSLLYPQQKVQEFYALKDVSFEVEQGEVLGIIGKNGSGKSTLLKILSRITAPTSGKITINGRVASLLEVGTGFHEELTGRENIFMSGIILGMKRWEIYKHFDEIVAFAGVEHFIDTPVKKYSSGMRLRLAFSVAAHLQPEILLVDEVLAVGDYEFEKKCIALMESITGTGRTILFVSHNLAIVRRLCKKTIVLSHGQLTYRGETADAISCYLNNGKAGNNFVSWNEVDAPGDDLVKIVEIKTQTINGIIQSAFFSNEEVVLSVSYKVLRTEEMFSTMLWFYDEQGNLLFSSLDTADKDWYFRLREKGLYTSICIIPANLLMPGKIFVTLFIITTGKGWRFEVNEIINFNVIDPIENTKIVGDWAWQWPHAAVRPSIDWKIHYAKEKGV